MSGTLAHSIVLRPHNEVPPHAVFTSYTMSNGNDTDPEVYPRPDGTVYICGESESEANVVSDPSLIQPKPKAQENLVKFANSFSSYLKDAKVEVFQACYVPWSPDHVPVIGAIPKTSGAYIAAGHGCWGILNSPATGLAMAELIANGRSTSVNIKAYDPARFFSGIHN